MFLVIDKHSGRIVKRTPARQEAIDFALKSSRMGGRQFILAEVFGETQQITGSKFIETNEVTKDDTAISRLRSRVCERQPLEIHSGDGPVTGQFQYQWDSVVQGVGSAATAISDDRGSGADTEGPSGEQ